MRKRHYRILILFMFSPFFTDAQIRTDTFEDGILFERDMRLELLIKKKAELNKRNPAPVAVPVPTKGFRIQIISTSNREEVLKCKSKILSAYPQHKAYLMYQAPYFKLRMGNFIEKEEANAVKRELTRIFPTGVIVIPSDIEVKIDKEAKEEKENKEKKDKNKRN